MFCPMKVLYEIKLKMNIVIDENGIGIGDTEDNDDFFIISQLNPTLNILKILKFKIL